MIFFIAVAILLLGFVCGFVVAYARMTNGLHDVLQDHNVSMNALKRVTERKN